MTEVYERDMNEDELLYLNSFLPTFKEKRNKFLIILALTSIMPLMAFIVFLSGSHHLSSIIWTFLIFTGISLAVAFKIYKNTVIVTGLDNYIDALKNGGVEIWIIKPLMVYKRKATQNIPVSFYIKTIINNENYTIFMQGKYIDEFEKTAQFPNSEFEITRTVVGDICLNYGIIGSKMNIKKTLSPFEQEEYDKGFTPKDFTIYSDNEINFYPQ